jgi:hypothetical protein
LMHKQKLNSLRMKTGGSCRWLNRCAAISNDFVAGVKTSVLREIATTMYLLAILRWVLELISGTQLRRTTSFGSINSRCVARFVGALSRANLMMSKWLSSGALLRDAAMHCVESLREKRAWACRGIPQDWISMDYVLSESSAADRLARGPFERPTHPLAVLVRIVRRLAGVPEACPALVPTRSTTNPRASGNPRASNRRP